MRFALALAALALATAAASAAERPARERSVKTRMSELVARTSSRVSRHLSPSLLSPRTCLGRLKRGLVAALPPDPRDAPLARSNALVMRVRRTPIDSETFNAVVGRITEAEELLFKSPKRERLAEAKRLLDEAERIFEIETRSAAVRPEL